MPAAVRAAVAAGAAAVSADARRGGNPFAAAARALLPRLEREVLPGLRAGAALDAMQEVYLRENVHAPAAYDPADAGSCAAAWRQPTLARTLDQAFAAYAAQPFLGLPTRARGYTHLTFAEVHALAQAAGSGLLGILDDLGVVAALEVAGDRPTVAICANNRVEWCLADLGCFYHGVKSVPLPRAGDVDALAFMINHSETSVVVCSLETLPVLRGVLASCPRVASVVLMDFRPMPADPVDFDDAVAAALAQPLPGDIPLMSFTKAVIARGQAYPLAPLPFKETDMAGLFYTSGSTGRPKGVVLSYENWTVNLSISYRPPKPFVMVSYLPLAHGTERTLYLVRGLKMVAACGAASNPGYACRLLW